MKSFFVFDVESIGLHGQAYAVGGGVYLENGATLSEFRFACDPAHALGDADDRKWVYENCPYIEATHMTPDAIRTAFWMEWLKAKTEGATMAADCGWPVEARFLCACVDDEAEDRKFSGPYPFLEISTMLTAAGMDPMKNYDRTPAELPKHDPLADARQSARLLFEALHKL